MENTIERWRRDDSRLAIVEGLAMMLDAKIPLADALGIMQRHHTDPWAQAFAEHAMAALESGQSLSVICRDIGTLFTPMDLHVMTISEQSNQLHKGLASLARYIKQKHAMQNAWQGALRYPKIMAAACLMLLWIMLQWVMPHFVALMQSFPHTPVHGMTAALCWLTLYVHAHPAITGASLGLFMLVTYTGIRSMRPYVNQLPFFRRIHQAMRECQVLNTLQLIAQAQLPWHEAMALMALPHNPHALSWQSMCHALEKGESLGQALALHPDIKPTLRASLEMACQSNQMGPMLNNLLRHQQQQCEQRIAALQQQLEPLFTCLIGGIIALVIGALYMPLLNIGKQLW